MSSSSSGERLLVAFLYPRGRRLVRSIGKVNACRMYGYAGASIVDKRHCR